MNSIYAIAGIDTGIGKTVVTGLIARHLRASGRDAITVKMVQTGNSGSSEDIAEHRRMCPGAEFREDALGLTAPQIFKYPSSPKLAAELEGRRVDLECISRSVKACSEAHEITLVEMAGGLCVPLDGETLAVDFVAREGWSVILVTCGRLGAINHALLSLEALRSRGMRLAGVVHDWHPEASEPIDRDAVETIGRYLVRYGFRQNIVEIPRIAGDPPWPDIDFSALFQTGEHA